VRLRRAAGLAALVMTAGFGLSASSSAERDLQDQVMRSQLRAYEQQRKNTEEAFRRDFELKFNRVVKAAQEFSRAYNEQKGMTWPQDKAEALSKAMADLQKQQQFRSVSARR